MKKRLVVAVVGATGAVGTEMIRVLEQRRFPVKQLVALASERSVGKRVRFVGSSVVVRRLTEESFHGVDLALFSAGADRSRQFAPIAAAGGTIVIDNSSAFRMDPQVPLVVPEVNAEALRGHRNIIANPNCSTIQMVVALKPLHDAARITRIVVATYQSASGAGTKAMYQLWAETGAMLKAWQRFERRRNGFRVAGSNGAGKRSSRAAIARVLPDQIGFNVIPQVDMFLPDGSTKEEQKMVNETRKIFGEPSLPMSATCVRVPVFIAHSEAVNLAFERELSPERARQLLGRAEGVLVVDDERRRYPVPVDAAGNDPVYVGRIRRDPSVAHGLNLWVVSDNLRKGAALNAVQIAERLFCR